MSVDTMECPTCGADGHLERRVGCELDNAEDIVETLGVKRKDMRFAIRLAGIIAEYKSAGERSRLYMRVCLQCATSYYHTRSCARCGKDFLTSANSLAALLRKEGLTLTSLT